MENAHNLIDGLIIENDITNKLKRIDPSTVIETRRGMSPFGGSINALYEALTYGGDKREIYRSSPGPDESGDLQPIMLRNLLKEISMNPDFSDTLTAETRPEIKTELNYSGQPLRYLKHLLGF